MRRDQQNLDQEARRPGRRNSSRTPAGRAAAVLLLACFSFLGGCDHEPSPKAQSLHTQRLPRCFSVLERLHVEAYRNQDWCKNIWYKRGKFSHQTEPPDTCNLFEGTPLPFDAQAQKDFEAVAGAIKATHVDLYYIDHLKYAPDGKLIGAEFHLLGGPNRYSYVYSPGYTSLPPDEPKEREHTRIDKDWYYVWWDWN